MRLLFILLPLVAFAGRPAEVPSTLGAQERGVTIPMIDFGGRPVVELLINGKGPFPFVLDTGAVRTVINSELARELQLPQMESDADRRHGTATVLIADVRLDGIAFRNVPALSTPSTRQLLKGPGAPVGVLPVSIFAGQLVTLDYPRKSISIQRGALPPADREVIFEYGPEQQFPEVPITIGGREIRVILDTGSGYGLMLPTRFATQLALTSPPARSGTAKTHSGEYPIDRGRVDGRVRLGRYDIDPTVLFTDVRAWLSAEPRGLLGYGVLKDFVVVLDTASRRIRLERPREASISR